MSLTTDPNDPRLKRGVDCERTGQSAAYLILSDEERAKGFLRPVRDSYIHAGAPGPRHPLRDLHEGEMQAHGQWGYVKYEVYPESESPVLGRFWTQAELDSVGKGCRAVTTMNRLIAETYARNPAFYGATYCTSCGKHLPVAEFRWTADGSVVGS